MPAALPGDVLNCNIFDVATHAAVELQADKLIIMRRDSLRASCLDVPAFNPSIHNVAQPSKGSK